MIEHWAEIGTAVIIVIFGVFIKTRFVTKTDWEKRCGEMRAQCQNNLCRKIESVSSAGILKTDSLTGNAAHTVEILEVIRKELSDVKAELSGLNRAFEQFLSDRE